MLKLTRIFINETKESQNLDLELVDRLVLVNQWKELDFRVDENGILKFLDKVYVHDVPELKKNDFGREP